MESSRRGRSATVQDSSSAVSLSYLTLECWSASCCFATTGHLVLKGQWTATNYSSRLPLSWILIKRQIDNTLSCSRHRGLAFLLSVGLTQHPTNKSPLPLRNRKGPIAPCVSWEFSRIAWKVHRAEIVRTCSSVREKPRNSEICFIPTTRFWKKKNIWKDKHLSVGFAGATFSLNQSSFNFWERVICGTALWSPCTHSWAEQVSSPAWMREVGLPNSTHNQMQVWLN